MRTTGHINTITALLLSFCGLVLIGCLLGCTPENQSQTPTEPPSLSGTAWQVSEMIDQVTGSDMARDVNPEHILTFKLKTDGTVSGTTPINNLEGTWSTEGSSITILLGERKNTEVADDQAELLMADFSMGTALVEARTFLLSDEATVLSLFDASGRMVLCAQAVK